MPHVSTRLFIVAFALEFRMAVQGATKVFDSDEIISMHDCKSSSQSDKVNLFKLFDEMYVYFK